MKNIWENAPSEATHYRPFAYGNKMYLKITHCHVESAWIPVSEECEFDFPIEGDYYRLDYTRDNQPVFDRESLIARVPECEKGEEGGPKFLSVEEVSSVKAGMSQTTLAKWLLDKAGSGSSDVELGCLTMSQAMQITKELEQEDKLHNFAVTVYSDNSAYVQRRSYYGEENEETDQYIFGFMLKGG